MLFPSRNPFLPLCQPTPTHPSKASPIVPALSRHPRPSGRTRAPLWTLPAWTPSFTPFLTSPTPPIWEPLEDRGLRLRNRELGDALLLSAKPEHFLLGPLLTHHRPVPTKPGAKGPPVPSGTQKVLDFLNL